MNRFEIDYTNIGPDPVKWLTRLTDINASSKFSLEQKELIDTAFHELIANLHRLKS